MASVGRVRPHTGWWLASLIFFLWFPGTGLVQRGLGLAGVALYLLGLTLAILALRRSERALTTLIARRYTLWAGLLALGLVLSFALVYPLETAGGLGRGSDRDEALNIAVHALAEGRNPYTQRTPLGGPITPLPGAIALAAPFVALGNSAYQNIFWLLLLLYASSVYLGDKASALLLLVTGLLGSPAAQYELISGGDLLANGSYVLVLTLLNLKVYSTPASNWLRLTSSLALGLGLASRPNFLLMLPLLFALLLREASPRRAAACVAGSALGAGLAILPFYLVDPASFTPLTAGNKLAAFNRITPYASAGVIAAMLALALVMAAALVKSQQERLYPRFFWANAAIQSLPLLCAVALNTLEQGALDFGFMHERHGLMLLWFGLWGCWPLVFGQPEV